MKYRVRVNQTEVREYIVKAETAEDADDKVMAGDCGDGRLVDMTTNDVEIEEVKD